MLIFISIIAVFPYEYEWEDVFLNDELLKMIYSKANIYVVFHRCEREDVFLNSRPLWMFYYIQGTCVVYLHYDWVGVALNDQLS